MLLETFLNCTIRLKQVILIFRNCVRKGILKMGHGGVTALKTHDISTLSSKGLTWSWAICNKCFFKLSKHSAWMGEPLFSLRWILPKADSDFVYVHPIINWVTVHFCGKGLLVIWSENCWRDRPLFITLLGHFLGLPDHFRAEERVTGEKRR